MNEKEEKSIETMQHWIEYEKANKDKINKADELIEIQETVLNLLEKEDKIIQFQKDINKTEQDRHKKIEKSLKGQIAKKDKIIDEMAYNIATTDSDLCQYIDETKRCKKYAGENKLTCDECIKQYFERKVEEDK